MSIIVNGTRAKNIVFNGKNVLYVKNKTSTNIYKRPGIEWTYIHSGMFRFAGGARYANGLWVACESNNSGLYWSEDGKTFKKSNITSGYFAGGARYANGLWVACGSVYSNNNSNGLYWSEDGKTWTQSNITSGGFAGGARYANGLWVACGYGSGLYWSENGKTWTQSNITSGYFNGGARYANGLWVACGDSGTDTFCSEEI